MLEPEPAPKYTPENRNEITPLGPPTPMPSYPWTTMADEPLSRPQGAAAPIYNSPYRAPITQPYIISSKPPSSTATASLPLPNVSEKKPKKKSFFKTKPCWIIGIIVVLIMVGAAIGIAVGVAHGRGAQQSQNSGDVVISPTTSASQTRSTRSTSTTSRSRVVVTTTSESDAFGDIDVSTGIANTTPSQEDPPPEDTATPPPTSSFIPSITFPTNTEHSTTTDIIIT